MVPGTARGVPGIAYATIVLAAVFSRSTLKDRLQIVIATAPKWDWLGAHLASLVALVGWSAIGRGDPSTHGTFWIWTA